MTKREKAAAKRWYDDACGTALAMEFVGERWSLLVLRELMFGPRRFGEIKANLPGVSANVLTQRLEGLEEAGILVKRKLPTTGAVHVYELTPWGLEIEPIFQTMGRWATRSRRHDPTLFLSPASAMLSLRAMIDTEKAKGMALTVAFRFPTDSFFGELADGDLVIRRGDTGDADITFISDQTTFAFTVYGKLPFGAESPTGVPLRVEGDEDAAYRFIDLFHLPEKIAD
ncbi:winged helix-turn-helix transcriptional regulator [Sphingomonas immobilis]|uniref:Winged helix-turn-helix transcriptional regulator n=1 Tax=Sphingomonas immobilis TaxID=3063997 RepID=A0ABT9A1N2_9SPHN|nr:winged helix-turn-helix transcriptional regulator [Sphingomonas sp. CA1-15]MDO7843715.1 winged helix-turn-helix transcriptional regulator [Sphingomonas sp. CA1-15]